MAPTVSVALITYNHAPYIRQAVEGVLSQEASFDIELVVGDDCSTDRTGDILNELASQYPDRIRLLRREHNVGMQQNVIDILSECRGKYLALLDGDDYWTDNTKLRTQVEFLESHTECMVCHHNVLKLFEDEGQRTERFHKRCAAITGLDELMRGNFIATCSTLYRWGVVGELPDWFLNIPCPDWGLHVLHALHGNIAYLPQTSAVYRVHSSGTWSSQSRRADLTRCLEAAKLLARAVPPAAQRVLRLTIQRWQDEFVEELIRANELEAAREYATTDCEDTRGFARLASFYSAIANEQAGQRFRANKDLLRAATTGVGRTRIGLHDILLALLRINMRRVYETLRTLASAVRKSE